MEDYDREFLENLKYNGDLNTTLIFVSPVPQWLAVYALTRPQAAPFSVVYAFTTNVQSQFLPNVGDETVALLQVLIHKIDKGQCYRFVLMQTQFIAECHRRNAIGVKIRA